MERRKNSPWATTLGSKQGVVQGCICGGGCAGVGDGRCSGVGGECCGKGAVVVDAAATGVCGRLARLARIRTGGDWQMVSGGGGDDCRVWKVGAVGAVPDRRVLLRRRLVSAAIGFGVGVMKHGIFSAVAVRWY